MMLGSSILSLHSQGYIVPNGVVTNFISREISVVHGLSDPSNPVYTGFSLFPLSANTFRFSAVVDVGVRVFFVSPNDPITATTIASGNYTEFLSANNYILDQDSPLYVGLYTGGFPTDGVYPNPLFGWARLENVDGTIALLDSALEYQGGGIFVGTQNIIPIPEPSTFALFAVAGLLVALRTKRIT